MLKSVNWLEWKQDEYSVIEQTEENHDMIAVTYFIKIMFYLKDKGIAVSIIISAASTTALMFT